MNKSISVMIALGMVTTLLGGCDSQVPPDEALARLRAREGRYDSAVEAAPTAESSAEDWKKSAEKWFAPAARDYFEAMDAMGSTEAQGAKPLALSPEGIKGRNAWVLWAAGNEAFWDWVARYGYGTIDLLKLVDYKQRATRFERTGMINEPGTREPTPDEEADPKLHGIRYARPVTDDADPKKVHVEYRKDRPNWDHADYDVYGYPSGVVGLRLFPNPEFTKEAEARWDAKLYYEDSEKGREYARRPNTIRPFRVGMSCGFCHIAPHPLNPPADPRFPDWANLSNNVGNQFLRMRAVFGNTLKPDNYLYHVYDSQLPGAVDTSGYPSDNNNNPNTINSFYGLRGRLARAKVTPKETIGPDTLAYLREYTGDTKENPRHVPRVLLDGSDSVDVQIALSRVYLNIGTHHQQWVQTHNPILGFRTQTPFKLQDIAQNSLYWHATLLRIKPMAQFFMESTDPMRLKDAPITVVEREKHLRGTGLPWYTDPPPPPSPPGTPPPAPAVPPDTKKPTDYAAGRAVFARGCIACHSSIQPGDLPELEAKLTLPNLPVDRKRLRLRPEDRVRLTRGDGTLPPDYARWAQEAVKHREFWEHKVIEELPDGKTQTVTVPNYLSIDERIPVTVTHTNSGRASATNALHGHVWEDFASETYKELPPVGPIRYRDPFSGAVKEYSPPGGGPGYYRVPTLASVWATAPFLHNNALGTFNNDPSVKGRLAAFDDAIHRLLTHEKRSVPSKQHYWNGAEEPRTLDDAWHTGKRESSDAAKSAERRDADGGWIWRTTDESSLTFDGAHVPTLFGGFLGLTRLQMRWLAWAPSLAFLVLGLMLLTRQLLVKLVDRLFGWFDWLTPWLAGFLAVANFAAAAVLTYYLWMYWTWVAFFDAVTQESIWGFRLVAVLAPVVFFASAGLLFGLSFYPALVYRRRDRVAYGAGLLCIVMAVFVALGLGQFLAGCGAGVKVGPIPEGVPVNILVNFDPDTSRAKQIRAVKALKEFVERHHKESERNQVQREALRVEFEALVAPAFRDASKCPDFVTDRGHDYEFIRHLTEDDKRELIALLKTL